MNKLVRQPRGALVPVTGERTFLRLANGARNSYLQLTARATITLAGAVAAAIRNRGSVWALFNEVILDENGRDRMVLDGRVLRFLAEMSAPSALTATRLTSLANGATVLEETVRLYFAHPLALDPLETSFIERDARQNLSLAIRMNANPELRLVDAGGTVSAVSVNVTQAYEEPGPAGAVQPLFIPVISQQTVQIAGAVSQQPEFIRGVNPIRALIVSQETSTVGEVSDIITSFVLRGDYRPIIGPAPMTLRDFQLDSEFEYGGAVVSSNRAHVGLNFQRYGRLSDVLNPQQDTNLRFEFTAAPSASAGTSTIRITRVELERDGAVVAPVVPFSY